MGRASTAPDGVPPAGAHRPVAVLAGVALPAVVLAAAVALGSAAVVVVAVAVVAEDVGPVGADGDSGDGAVEMGTSTPQSLQQVPYNGDFTFTRIRYGGGGLRGFRRFGGSSWSHDYPQGDLNMQTILAEFTALESNTGGSNVFDLEDPEIFRHPILYISEPGYWSVTEEGARNLRNHLLKGGFLILDDFEEDQWYNMAAQLYRALPEYEWIELDDTHAVFQTFFFVEDIYVPHPLVPVMPNYLALFEGNDPAKRIMVLANHNADLAEYWEYSATGFFPVDPTNDAYRLGVNYILYGVTH